MALTVTGENPFVVVASADDDEGAITTKEVSVAFLIWTAYDSTSDTCEVQDTAGDVVFIFPANTTAGVPMISPRIDKKYVGLKIPTNGMDTGTLYIYRND